MRAWLQNLVAASGLLFALFVAPPALANQVGAIQPTDCPPADLFVGSVPPAVRNLGVSVSDVVRAGGDPDPCGVAFGARPKEAAAQIGKWGGTGARVTTLPILFEGKDGSKATLPVYRVQRRDGKVAYVDHVGRWYESWDDWKDDNKLPEGKMTFPKNGDLTPGKGCAADPETAKTPASSVWRKAMGYVDTAAAVAGVAVGVAAIVGTGGLAIPVVGAGLMAYGAVRSGGTLHDLWSHKQTVNPLESAEARGAWIGLGSSVIGLGAMGATVRAGAVLASQGAQAGASAANVAAHLQVASQVANTVGIADLGYNVTTNWQHLSNKERAMALSQIVFWAGMTAHSAHRAGGFRNLYDARAIRESLIRSYAPDAVVVPDPVMDDLKGALRKMGIKADDPAEVRRVLSMETSIPDSAVEALRNEVLTNPKYAGEVGEMLRHYTAEALAKGVDTPEGRMLRLELLMLAVPEKTRPALMEAVRIDMTAHSDRIKGFLSRQPQGGEAPKVKRVIIGGGSQGATLANELNRIGQGDGTLVVDASRAGDQNFGSIRNFRLNSESGEYHGRVGGNQPGRTQNPLHNAPIQVEDLLPPTPGSPFPDAGSFGDAQVLALHAARRTGTDVMTETRVVKVTGKPGDYLVHMEDVSAGRAGSRYVVRAEQVVDATGLGKPSVPLRDPASNAYINDQASRITRSPGAISTQAVTHGEDLLRAYTNASKAERSAFLSKADGNIVIVGGGDAAKTAAELLQRIATENNTTVKDMLGTRKIEWIGIDPQNDFWTRYAGLKELFDSGTATQLGGRVEKIEPLPGNRSRITLKMPDGTFQTKEAGRVVLAMGMRSQSPGIYSEVLPEGFDWKTGRQPVLGNDPVFGNDSPIATRIPGHDIYFAGLASGLERAPNHSFLEYFGWKNLLVADQVLADGRPVASPFKSLRTAGQPTVAHAAPGVQSEAAIARSNSITPVPGGDAQLAARTGLQGALAFFEFPGMSSMDLTFARENGSVVLRTQGLDPASARAVADVMSRSPAYAGLMEQLTASGPVRYTVNIQNGRVIGVGP